MSNLGKLCKSNLKLSASASGPPTKRCFGGSNDTKAPVAGIFWAVRSSAQFSGEFERIARFGYAGVNVAANLLMFRGIYMIFLDLTYAS